ncbi:MAG: secretin N-terminal domain-containing protein [Candidatus Solibacter sp.]
MKRIALWALLVAAPLLAQNNPQVTKLVILKNIDQRAVTMLQSWGVSMVPSGSTNSIALSGPQDKVAAVEAAIKQLDVPAKSVELTVYFVVGGDQATLAGSAVPQDLRDVIAQLKGAFAFKEYKMLDTLSLRTRTGSPAETSGILNSASPPRMSQFSIRSAAVTDDGSTVRIDRMHAGLRLPYSKTNVDAKAGIPGPKTTDYINSGIDQDIDIKVGQKVVVGRSSLEGPQQALFLILTATVIQ